MAKNKPETMEHIPQFDGATYQTGAIKEPRGSSGLVALLLLVVIFLGGICSVLGVINIRLLSQLADKKEETVPIDQEFQIPDISTNSILDQLDLPLPELPAKISLRLQTQDSPYYTLDGAQNLTQQQIQDKNAASLVRVQSLTHFNSTEDGIGLVLSKDGYILTNSHVVDAAKRIFVTLSDGTVLRAALVGRDNFSDLAVLYIDRQDLTPATFSSNRHLQVTDPTWAFEAGEAEPAVRISNIFSIGREFSTKSHTIHLIQTCAGGSTGPVFDSFGHVIGFQVGNIAAYFPTVDTKGTGLVVPTASISQILKSLLEEGRVNGQPSLGMEVETISKIYQQYWQLPSGLLLTGINQNSNAALNGLQEGDILLALDGKPVQQRSDLYKILYNLQVGDSVIAVISRNNQKFTVKLTIEDNAME
jgi:serine protease Do